MLVAVIDTETTGLSADKIDEVIEFCGQVYDTETDSVLTTLVQRYRPTVRITPKAEQIHGISLDDLKDEPPIEQTFGRACSMLSLVDLIVAHNVGFDMPFIEKSAKLVNRLADVKKPTFCTMLNGTWATWDSKLPNLSELCYTCGVEYDDEKSHSALFDVSVTTQCFAEGLRRGLFKV